MLVYVILTRDVAIEYPEDELNEKSPLPQSKKLSSPFIPIRYKKSKNVKLHFIIYTTEFHVTYKLAGLLVHFASFLFISTFGIVLHFHNFILFTNIHKI